MSSTFSRAFIGCCIGTAISFVLSIIVLASDSTFGLVYLGTFFCAISTGVSLYLEKICRFDDRGLIASRILIGANLVTGTFMNYLALFESDSNVPAVINGTIFLTVLFLTLFPASSMYVRYRVANSNVPQGHSDPSFKVGDRIKMYRQFLLASWCCRMCPCVLCCGFMRASMIGGLCCNVSTSGFAEPGPADESDAEHDAIYVVHAIDHEGRRVLLAKDNESSQGKLIRGAWYSGSEDYYKVFPYGQGPAYFYDCFQAVNVGEGQSAYRPPVVDSKLNVNETNSSQARKISKPMAAGAQNQSLLSPMTPDGQYTGPAQSLQRLNKGSISRGHTGSVN